MRHKVYGKHLSRNKNQRTALFRSLAYSLFLKESITTTEAKAKAIKGLVDRLIVKAKEGSSASKRVITSILPDTAVSRKLTEEIASWYKDRSSGFTEIIRLGPRIGDGTMMVRMNLIKEESKQEGKKAIASNKGSESRVLDSSR